MRTLLLVSVLIGAPALSQSNAPRSPAALSAVVGERRGQITGCYDEVRTKAPEFAGKFVYGITIGTDGKVKKAVAQAPTPDSQQLDRCVTRVLAGLVFAPGAEVTVAYPLVFQPPAQAAPAPAAKQGAEVDPKLVKLFNAAASKAKAGKHKQALDGYRAVLALQKKKNLPAIPRFLATVQLHVAYALIDLGKLAEAEKALKGVEVDTLGKPTQYDYHFTLGNVLGGQRKLKPMFSELVEAISIAEELNDMIIRPEQCWTKILAFTMKAEDWAFLNEVSGKALQVAKLRGYSELETKAIVAQTEARAHLKK